MVKKNTCVFISGKGTNLKNLILKSRDYNFPINIKLVVCNNKKAEGIKLAKINSIPLLLVNTNKRNLGFTPEKKYVCGDAELDLLIN